MTATAPKRAPTASSAGKRRRSTASKWSEPAEFEAGLSFEAGLLIARLPGRQYTEGTEGRPFRVLGRSGNLAFHARTRNLVAERPRWRRKASRTARSG